jgi:hypothetical protein
MSNVYVEARPRGRPDHSPIDDFVVENHADHVLHTAKTQLEAITWAMKEGHSPLVGWSPGSGTSTTRRSRTTGGPPSAVESA